MTRVFTPEETATWKASLDTRWSSAGVAMINSDEKVLVVKANYKAYWSFPGGIIDKSESPLEAAIREVREEVGVILDADDIQFRFVADRTSPRAQTFMFLFETRQPAVDAASIAIDETEIEAYEFVTKQQILESDKYSESTKMWAQGFIGYTEQTII
jgi:8-oxo-dGTP pyrophosphatase MutT (NUDIX family)